MGTGMTILFCVIALAVGLGIGALLGFLYRKKIGERLIGSAEQEADRVREAGFKDAAAAKKEALISAKEEILKAKNEADAEIKERRNEVTKMERRCVSKEEALEKKLENLERKT